MLLEIPSAESLMIAPQRDIVNDIIAREIYKASLAGKSSADFEGMKVQDPEVIQHLLDKGYEYSYVPSGNGTKILRISW